MRCVLWVLLIAAPAYAERYVVQPGETIGHVAAMYGCSTELVERVNHLDTSIVKVGTVIEVPSCKTANRTANRPRTRAGAAHEQDDDDEKARQALAVIDGATWISGPGVPVARDRGARDAAAQGDESIGAPWKGQLAHAEKLETGDGYIVRRPSRAFGAKHVVEQLRAAIGEVRALYPDVHTLAIGDLSAEHGGKISDHRSHQSGLDVDVGFYFTKRPAGYPAGFVDANGSLDLEATWALLAAFARTAALDDGVQMIFLDYDVQRRLYEFAKRRGTPERELDFMFQYPHGRDELSGLVRHWPGHANHMHVRFKPRA